MGDKGQILDEKYDVVIIGAGGAGMSSALFAAKNNLKVLILEESDYVGGTTAFSAGTTWIPNTDLAATVGCKDDSIDKVKKYLKNVLGENYDESMIDAFLTAGDEAINEIQKETYVRYKARDLHPDYQSEEKGATLFGRALEPLPFDARLLGERFGLVRPPIPEFTILGGMMVDRDDIKHLLSMKKSVKSFLYSFKLISRYGMDRLKYNRGTKLVMGNALIASLLHSLDERQVPILLKSQVTNIDFKSDESALLNIHMTVDGKEHSMKTKNIILATGGINRNPAIRNKLTPNVDPTWSPGMPGHKGTMHDLLENKPIQYGVRKGPSDYFWAPVSIRKRKDGTQAVFPHFILDRGKPHIITINQEGKRFVNESTSYHLFGVEMLKQGKQPSYLITDKQGLFQYGLGMIRPNSKAQALEPFLQDGYLIQGDTIEALASSIDVPADILSSTINIFNSHAENGEDPDFNRGTTDYQRVNGDANYHPNPNLAPLKEAPYYAIKLYPGDIGAATGIKVTPDSEVLDKNNQVINGLYAVGNDMHSIMEGSYPGPGITLGPGLVFSWRAIKSILNKE